MSAIFNSSAELGLFTPLGSPIRYALCRLPPARQNRQFAARAVLVRRPHKPQSKGSFFADRLALLLEYPLTCFYAARSLHYHPDLHEDHQRRHIKGSCTLVRAAPQHGGVYHRGAQRARGVTCQRRACACGRGGEPHSENNALIGPRETGGRYTDRGLDVHSTPKFDSCASLSPLAGSPRQQACASLPPLAEVLHETDELLGSLRVQPVPRLDPPRPARLWGTRAGLLEKKWQSHGGDASTLVAGPPPAATGVHLCVSVWPTCMYAYIHTYRQTERHIHLNMCIHTHTCTYIPPRQGRRTRLPSRARAVHSSTLFPPGAEYRG